VIPRYLRAKSGVSLPTMAKRLGVTVDDVRTLEATDLGLWETRVVRSYCAALGHELMLCATRPDGKGEVLT